MATIKGKTDYRRVTDCSYFIQGRCWKGSECVYRHFNPARRSSIVCRDWLDRNCLNERCHEQHPANSGAPKRGQSTLDLVTVRRSPFFEQGDQRRCKSMQSLQRARLFSQDTDEEEDELVAKHGNMNKKQLLLKGLIPSTQIKLIETFVKRLSGIAPSAVKLSHDKKSALVSSKQNFDIDSMKIRMGGNRTLALLNGSFIELHPVPYSDQALIPNIPVDVREDDLLSEIRKITGAYSVKSCNFDSCRNYAIVKFTKSTFLRSLWGKTLKIGQSVLSYYFYDGEFMTDEIYEIIHGRNKTIRVKVDEHILAFVMKRKLYLTELKDEIEEVLGCNNFVKQLIDNECYVQITIEDYSSALEKSLRCNLTNFFSKFATVKVTRIPDVGLFVLRISMKPSNEFMAVRNGTDVIIVGLKEKTAEVKLECEKYIRGTRLESLAKQIELSVWPGFQEDEIVELLKTEKGQTFFQEWDKIGSLNGLKQNSMKLEKTGISELVQAESFKNLTCRILNKHCVATTYSFRRGPSTRPMSSSLRNQSSGLSVQLVVGDIAEQKVDVIVNSTDGTLKSGSCSQSLFSKGGQSLVDSCEDYSKRKLLCEWSMVITRSGNLDCRRVYHILLGDYNSERLEGMIIKVLDRASSNGHRSIAFPFVGTGGKRYDRVKVAKIFKKVLEEYENRAHQSSLNIVKIIAHEKDRESIRVLKEFFNEEIETKEKTENTLPVSMADMKFIGFDHADLQEACNMVQKYIEENIVKTSFKIKALADCPAKIKSKLFQFAEEHKVSLKIDKHGEVTLEGTPNANSIVTNFCHEELKEYGKDEAVKLPSTWSKMPTKRNGNEELFHLVDLSTLSAEYQKVKQNVLQTAGGQITNIERIWRVQNPQLYRSYMIRKAVMDKTNGSSNNERSLYHGTRKDHCDLINHYGFNRSFAGTHGAAYGDGNYFARDSRYSVSYAKQDKDGKCYMYMVKVLVGEYTQGARGMKTPPLKGAGTLLYDSVVDNALYPSIFVVFPDNQMYPEYLIQFT